MKPEATPEEEDLADRALDEIKAMRRIIQALRPFSSRQRARILAFALDEAQDRARQAELNFTFPQNEG